MRVVKDIVQHEVAAADLAEADGARAARRGLRHGSDEGLLRLGPFRRGRVAARAAGAVAGASVLRRRRRRGARWRRRGRAHVSDKRERAAVRCGALREAKVARVAFDRVQNEVHETVDALLVRAAPVLALAERRGRGVHRRREALCRLALIRARVRRALIDDEIEYVVRIACRVRRVFAERSELLLEHLLAREQFLVHVGLRGHGVARRVTRERQVLSRI